MTILKDCIITRSDAKVLREYCDSKYSPLYREYKGFNTSVNLTASLVYNMYAGDVIMISGDVKSTYDVVVSITRNQAIRYRNLKSIAVKLHQYVDISDLIGAAKTFVKIEYLSSFTKTDFVFRLGDEVFYKDDPMKILDSETSVISRSSPQYLQSGLRGFVDAWNGGVDDSMRKMLSDNKGE